MNEDKYTLSSGYLRVSNLHSIYYHEWGNKDAKPIFMLHGGPGGNSKDKNKISFDPKIHRVVFHDQRGCGKSTPLGCLEENNTANLVNDIEALRKHINTETIMLTGGSWGSTLALAYAETYPGRVEKMLLWGIFSGRKSEIDYIQQGGISSHYPDVWEKYIELVPIHRQNDTVKYYLQAMQDINQEAANEHVARWCSLEISAMSIDANVSAVAISAYDVDASLRNMAIMEAHYFNNSCFLKPNQIYNEAHKLKQIPIVLVQGRHDNICTPQNAFELTKHIGENCRLHFTSGGHALEAGLRDAVKAYMWSFMC